ncbi:MAG: ABC transporter ATP-binding protein [Myxococcota bacterium]
MSVLRQLSAVLGPEEKKWIALLFVAQCFGALLEVVGVGAIPAFVAIIVATEGAGYPPKLQAVFDTFGFETPQTIFFASATALFAFFVLKNSYLAVLSYWHARFASRQNATIANRLFAAYIHAPYRFHLTRSSAELIRNTDNDAMSVAQGVLTPVLNIAMDTLMLVAVGALLLSIEPLIAAVLLLVLGTLTVGFYRTVRSRITDLATLQQKYKKRSIQTLQQSFLGLKDARLFGREDHFYERYAEATRLRGDANQFRSFILSLPRLYLEISAVVGMLGVSAYILLGRSDSRSALPVLSLVAMAVYRVLPSFQRLVANISTIRWGEKALNVVYRDLTLLEAMPAHGPSHEARPAAPARFPLHRSISISDVSVRYPEQDTEALQGISLEIARGASIGFVGRTGSGKTTLVDVLLGILDPDAGRIRVDDVDIQSNLRGWRSELGYVSQSIFLVDDTISRNVAFGFSEDAIDSDEVRRALRDAQLGEFVEELPNGIDTVVGENGIRLSGGQRQRLGIARALYHRPSVLVLDEATSALDNKTEKQFVDALDALRGDLTLVVVAHRLSTVRDCDCLYVFERGRIAASGTFDELLRENTLFRELAAVEAEGS